MTTAQNAKSNRTAWGLVTIAVTVRILCIVAWPSQWYSIDQRNWQSIAAVLLVGINPYAGNTLLNWPPMWMEILYLIARFSDRSGWQFLTCVRLALTFADAVLIFSTCALLRMLCPGKKIFGPVLWGLCLNPLLILITIQQGNFDVIPSFLILWFLIFLIRFCRGGERVDWLIAATWLGLGTYAKTFPLVLFPLLLAESRRLDWKTRLLGAALCLVPSAISLAPLFALAPHDVTNGVLLYRGTPGTIGVSGLILMISGRPALAAYAPIFTTLLALSLVGVTLALWFRPLKRDADLVLFAALMLMAVFLFGPGNSLQYWYWVAPLLVAVYLEYPGSLARTILIAAVLINIANLFAFAYFDPVGAIYIRINPAAVNGNLYRWINSEPTNARICLPVTIVSFLLWLLGVRSIVAPAENPAG
jgi:hypothetical protein